MRSIVVGVSADELAAWFGAMPGLKGWGNSALRRKLGLYRRNRVTPAFVAKLAPAVIATFNGKNASNLGTDSAITLSALHREGIAMDYYLPLIAASATPEDVSRFWGDGVELEYALSLLGR